MKKTKIRVFTALFAAVLCLTAFSTTAFAGGGEEYTEPIPEVVETPKPDPVPLTPDGNLTLVDDIEGEQAEDKQFVTMQSKNGNYFYLVIDRAGKEDNVYFLNLVDEADLLALIEDETPPEPPKVCGCKEKCEAGSVKADCPICQTDLKQCVGKTAESTEPVPEKKSNTSGILLVLLIAALGGGGAFYYFKVLKNKPKTKGSTDLSEYEFDEDEDTGDEDYEVEDDAEAQDDAESEDDTK